MEGLSRSRLRIVLVVVIACCGCLENGMDLQLPDPGDPRFSLEGTVHETALSGVEEWTLPVDLPAQSYVRFVVEATGVRVRFQLAGPEGRGAELGQSRFDCPTPVSLVSETAGIHTLILRCQEDENTSGIVTLRVTEMRPEKQRDRFLVRAERLFSEAEDLRYSYTAKASREAICSYEEAFSIWNRKHRFEEAARARQRIGLTYEQIGNLDASLKNYRDGLKLSQKSSQPALESELMTEVGFALCRLGEVDRAEELCEEARSLAHEIESTRADARALFCFAEVEYHRGNHEAALDLYRQVEPLLRSGLDRRGLAQALYYMGTIFSDLSDLETASSYLSDSLHLWGVLEDDRGKAIVLAAMGRLQDRRGENQLALNYYNQARQLMEPMGDIVWDANVLGGMGMVYEKMAEHQNALRFWFDTVALYEKAGLPTAVVDSLIGLGQNYLALGDHARALESFRRALDVSDDLGDQRLSAYALTDIGRVHQSRGEPRLALEFFQRSLDRQRAVDDLRLESFTLGNMGLAHFHLGEQVEAFGYFTRSLSLSRTAGDRLGETTALFNLARIAGSRGDAEIARTYLEESLEIAEKLRGDVDSQVLRNSYFASIQQYYELYIDLLMSLYREGKGEGLDALAFEVSERARARSLSESLTEAGVDIRHGIDPELLQREREVAHLLDSKSEGQMRLLSGGESSQEAKAIAHEIRELTTEYDQLQAEIRSRSPRYAALTQPAPLGLYEAQRQILDEHTLVLEYSLGDERSFLWAVESGEHASFELSSRDEIERLSREVYELLTARIPVTGETVREYRLRVRQADVRYWEAAGRLADMLLGPVSDRLSEKRIVIVSDGALQYVPFSALPLPGRANEHVPLIASNEVVNLPSMSALSVLREQARGRKEAKVSVAVLADPVFELDDPRLSGDRTSVRGRPAVGSNNNPDAQAGAGFARALRGFDSLPEAGIGIPRMISTRREAEAILAMAPENSSLLAMDFEASRSQAMNPELGRYRIVHFATHGVVNNEQPGLSGVVLSMVDEIGRPQNGFLRLDDIYKLDLPVKLVVLSACDSALGKPVEGEGLVGIVRGFMTAGARSVVASLWKVDDEATGDLMRLFYREMFEENRPPAVALRNAQISMWRHEDWNPPFFWAAFVLQGEWL